VFVGVIQIIHTSLIHLVSVLERYTDLQMLIANVMATRVVLYCSSQDNLDAYVHLEERKYFLFLGQLKQGYRKRSF
jgi:hypothetical protein